MRPWALTLLRTLLSFWSGAAVLFIATSVREITSPIISDASREVLPSVRFPLYYSFGLICISLAWTFCLGLVRMATWPSSRGRILLQATSLLLIVFLADYLWIFRSLQEMMLVGVTDSDRFVFYHRASMGLNAVGLILSLGCAWMSNWPISFECPLEKMPDSPTLRPDERSSR